MHGTGEEAGEVRHGADWEAYLAARWADLVAGLEADGVDPDVARLAVAATLLAARRGWRRRTREQQVDLVVWDEARERAGLPPGPGPVPHAVGRRDPTDDPGPWLDRARAQRGRQRRRSVRRGLVAAAVVALLGVGWAWWAARPEVPPVREEDNRWPVAWYADGEMHLARVVVGLPDVEEFVADGAGVVARLGSGQVVRIDTDGEVQALDQVPPALAERAAPPAYLPPGRYDTRIQSVRLDSGGWAHLIDSSRRGDAQDAIRQSESGRRALVVCPTVVTCEVPIPAVADVGSIRLR